MSVRVVAKQLFEDWALTLLSDHATHGKGGLSPDHASGPVSTMCHNRRVASVHQRVRGKIGIVGPRPTRPEFVVELEEGVPVYLLRHAAKPGAPGWALVKQGYASSVEDAQTQVQQDLYPIKYHSLHTDARLPFKTVGGMWSPGGR
jgi:hypothetical protein